MERLESWAPVVQGAEAIANVEQRLPVDELVHKAQAGDLRAFEQLYRRHLSRVYAICLRMTGDPGTAEELTQQAFIRAWEKLELFQGERRFGPWLHRLAINVVLSHRRAWSRHRAREKTTGDMAELSHPNQAAHLGWGLDIERAMAKLPSRARQVFFLHDVEGYRHGEIAEMLGVATGTSKAQLHRARKLLREVLRK